MSKELKCSMNCTHVQRFKVERHMWPLTILLRERCEVYFDFSSYDKSEKSRRSRVQPFNAKGSQENILIVNYAIMTLLYIRFTTQKC